MDNNSLAHTKWRCKYHIVFAPKYRRQVIYGKIKMDIGGIIRQLCEYKKEEIIEAEAYPDHVHMLVSIPPKKSYWQHKSPFCQDSVISVAINIFKRYNFLMHIKRASI